MGGRTPSIPLRCGSSHGGSTSASPRWAGIFVRREPRTVGRDLEQHAAGLPEVHRLEPEPIDDAGRVSAGRLDLRPHGQLMRVIVHAPGQMVHRAHAPAAAPLVGRLADVHEAGGVAEPVPRPSVFVAQALEAERAGEEAARRDGAALPQPRAVEAANLPFRRHGAAIPRRERPRRSRGAFDERQAKPVRVDDRKVPVAESRLHRVRRERRIARAARPSTRGCPRESPGSSRPPGRVRSGAAHSAPTERTSGRCPGCPRRPRRTGDTCPGRPGSRSA